MICARGRNPSKNSVASINMQKAIRLRVDSCLAICASYGRAKDLRTASLLRQNSITAFFQLPVIPSGAEQQGDVVVVPLLNKSEHSGMAELTKRRAFLPSRATPLFLRSNGIYDALGNNQRPLRQASTMEVHKNRP